MALFMSRGRNETVPDQWQTQILLRILQRARVIYISEAPDTLIREMHMIPAGSIEEAMGLAGKLLQTETPTVTAIPDGIAVMVVENNA